MRWRVAAGAILLATGIAVALPAPGGLSSKIYAQQLVDEVLIRHPEVLLIGMHVTPPGETDNVIIASNFGRLRKKADEDDVGVIRTGHSKAELNAAKTRFAVELPLHDLGGNTIGALGLNFAYKDGDDRQSLEHNAETIRNELKRRTADAANLVEPYPFDPAATTLTHAQKLVDRMLAQHAGLLAMRLCTASSASACSVIASSVGRIGGQADRMEIGVMRTGKPLLEVDAAHPERLNAHLPLLDSGGKVIGIVTLVHPYRSGDDTSALLASSARIRDALSSQVTSTAALLALDP
jgi:hypothetical protein